MLPDMLTMDITKPGNGHLPRVQYEQHELVPVFCKWTYKGNCPGCGAEFIFEEEPQYHSIYACPVEGCGIRFAGPIANDIFSAEFVAEPLDAPLEQTVLPVTARNTACHHCKAILAVRTHELVEGTLFNCPSCDGGLKVTFPYRDSVTKQEFPGLSAPLDA